MKIPSGLDRCRGVQRMIRPCPPHSHQSSGNSPFASDRFETPQSLRPAPVPAILAADEASEVRRIYGETREDRIHSRRAQVARRDLAEDVAEIGGQGQVAAFIQLAGVEAGPFAIDLAAFDVAAKREKAK